MKPSRYCCRFCCYVSAANNSSGAIVFPGRLTGVHLTIVCPAVLYSLALISHVAVSLLCGGISVTLGTNVRCGVCIAENVFDIRGR